MRSAKLSKNYEKIHFINPRKWQDSVFQKFSDQLLHNIYSVYVLKENEEIVLQYYVLCTALEIYLNCLSILVFVRFHIKNKIKSTICGLL